MECEDALRLEVHIAQLRAVVQHSGQRILGLQHILHSNAEPLWVSDDFNEPIDFEDWSSPSDPLSTR